MKLYGILTWENEENFDGQDQECCEEVHDHSPGVALDFPCGSREHQALTCTSRTEHFSQVIGQVFRLNLAIVNQAERCEPLVICHSLISATDHQEPDRASRLDHINRLHGKMQRSVAFLVPDIQVGIPGEQVAQRDFRARVARPM